MDPALLLRTVDSLRSNFESLRRFDPIPALMAESPPGHTKDFVISRGCPTPPVHPWGASGVRWLGGSTVFEDEKPVASRNLWAAGPRSATTRLTLAAEASAGFAPILRETVGISKYSRASSPRDQWLWTVFEVAAAEPPYSVLRLKGGGVFRMAEGGVVRALVTQLEEIQADGLPADSIEAALLRRDFSPVKYWELKDFVEASLWALDLVAVALPAAIDRERGSGVEVVTDAEDDTEDSTRRTGPGRRRKRTAEGLSVDQWVAAMAAGDPSFRHLSEKQAEAYGGRLFAARTIGTCEIWIQMKAQLEAEKREAAERAEAELADRHGEDEDGNGLRQSSTKHGTGKQRATRKDLEHERDVAAFLRSKGEQSRKKRAK